MSLHSKNLPLHLPLTNEFLEGFPNAFLMDVIKSSSKESSRIIDKIEAIDGVIGVIIGCSYGGKSLGKVRPFRRCEDSTNPARGFVP